MRRPSPRLFNLSVLVTRLAWGADGSSGRTSSIASTDRLRASAQPLSADRTPEPLRATGRQAYQVLFPSDPLVSADDTIELPGGALLNVAAPAIDEAGRGVMFTVMATRAE